MEKRTAIIAKIEDGVVRYSQTDDCYICPYDTGDKFADHTCRLTGEYLHPSGRVDIDVPETCPFPVIGHDVDDITAGIIDRYGGVSDRNLNEIKQYIDKGKRN